MKSLQTNYKLFFNIVCF